MHLFANLRHSRELIRACSNLLLADKTLIWFPVISLITTGILLAALIPLTLALANALSICGLVIVVPLYFFAIFSAAFYWQVTLVSAVLKRFDGDTPTFFESFHVAHRRSSTIFRFAGLATLMWVAQVILEILTYALSRGSVSSSRSDQSWRTETILCLPVLAMGKGSTTMQESIEESAALIKETWGEKVSAHTGLGQFFFVLSFVVGLAVFGLLAASSNASFNSVLLTLAVVYVILIETISGTLSTVYSAVLYRYAKTGTVPPNFDIEKVKTAFKFRTQAAMDRHQVKQETKNA